MYTSRRPRMSFAVFFFIAASLVLVACGVGGTNTNWPGLTTDGRTVYLANGPSVLAFDVETQEEVWSYPPEASALAFYAAPSVQDGRVIFGDYGASSMFSPEVKVSLYARSGSDSVPAPLPSEIKGRIVAPPIQVGNRVFVGTGDGLVYAIDAESGTVVWKFETGHSIWGRPAFKDGILFVNSLDKTIYAIEAETGAEMWRKEVNGALASAPVVNLDLLYVASFDKHLYALDIDSGEEAWSFEATDWIWSTPAYDQGVVYFADAKGNVFALDGATGEQRWKYDEIGRPVRASPVVAGENVYVAYGPVPEAETPTGALTALKTEDGEMLWEETLDAPLYTTPVVVDDVIVVAVNSGTTLLKALTLEAGDEAWTIPQPGASESDSSG